MSEDGLWEEDLWQYKSVRKLKSLDQNSEAICTNVQKTNDEKGKSQRSGSRKISTAKEIPKKTKQIASQTPLKPDLHVSVSNGDPAAHSQRSVPPTSAKRKKNYKKRSPSKARPVYEGYCPSCQIPFPLLLIQTPRWHVTECLDGSRTAEKECPDGLLCTSTIPSHYKRYSHFLLAASRAGEYVAEFSSSTENNFFRPGAAPSISCNAFNYGVIQDLNDSQNVGKPPKQCLLLPKQSSAATNSMDVTRIKASSLENIKGSEHRIQSIGSIKQVECPGLLSQEYESGEDLDSQHGSYQLNKLISEADLSDCDITYSPLNTDEEEAIQTEEEEQEEAAAQIKCFRKKLFSIGKLEEKNGRVQSSMFKKSLSSSQLWEFEHNSAKIIPACTANKELHDVSNALQSVDGISWPLSQANPEVQTIPAKELKQMDIGVFFGLQPKAKMESDPKKIACERTQTLSPSAATGKKPRSRKRKAEGSVGDSDVITESSDKNASPAAPTSGGHRRWRKKFKESCPAEEETRKKQCPFYKKIPGTGFVVDAFQYGEIEGCKGYFLTHFHSDHYGGLTKKFTFPIYCNKITGNLLKSKLHVQEQFVHILPMDTECIINGIKVVLLDANHCPGAAMILFIFTNGTVILHTGDFRADPSMERYPFLIGRKVHTLYLDTTYCSPEYTFPSQQEVIQFAVNTAFEMVTLNPRTLVVCGTYSVGKEKVFLAVAEVLGSKVSMSQDKYKTVQCLESAAINSLITLDWNNTLLHLLPMMQINFKTLQSHLNKFSENFDHILAFKPTGWTYSNGCSSLSDIQPQTRGRITIYGIPYSEHSSFLEMKQFVQWLKPQKIIPTVNVGNWKARNEMEKHFRDWKMEASGWN